ncbi:cytochrome c3 family protein [Desulfococcus sp.]|uniref:cytochrome c3 family protein n=1 Tax=Desulfococcus sp. TaxID=2025834 RepID=UPI0035943D9B
MDRKTLALILTEVVLIVALVVVVAMDFNKKPHAEGIADTAVAEKATEAAPEEGVSEEKAPAAIVAKAEEAVEEKAPEAAEAKTEKAVEAKKPAKEEKPAEKIEAAKPVEKAATAAKASGSGVVADVIAMNEPAYAKHTKTIVQFTHKKHTTEYKSACGDCHHNEKAEPLTELKEGDAVQRCIECHPKASKAPAPKKGEKMSDSEKMEYHAEALHANCIDCHKEHNKKNNTKAAPTSCATCHPKEAK